MTKQEQLLALFKACMCDEDFCNVCPNQNREIIDCDQISETLIKMCHELMEENAALRADIQKMAETRSDCIVCDHYIKEAAKPHCELNGWHCDWKWRGLEKYKAEHQELTDKDCDQV